jgi:hypothetical protein
VEPAGAHGEGEIGPVVDDEEGAGLSAALAEGPGDRVELGQGRPLVAELDEPTPSCEDRLEERAEVALAGELRIQDHVEGRRERHVTRSILQIP